MNTKRVLLSCTVISLQDTRFVYPCCKICLCRVIAESNSRIRCPKCGFTCETQNVDYRFRLSLKVTRDTRVFGVTVFGGCLNPFFGITAGGLQRFLESETFKGPPSLQQLLIKAVEDCFIGKCLVFGLKLSAHNAKNVLLGEPATDELVQFVACQVIPPHGALLGVTVFAYLQSLMQVNAPADCFTNTGCQWQEKDLTSFDHTLPLCQNSYSASDNDSSTHIPPWNFVSDLDLCFSQDEIRKGSVPEVLVDANDSQKSLALLGTNRQRTKVSPFKLSVSKHTKHNRSSTFYSSSFNSSFISPIKTVPSVVHSSKHLPFIQWAAEDCFSQINASFFEKSLFNYTSFALEDAPLSKTLGDFVSTEWQIVNQQVFNSKETPGKPENNTPNKNNIVPSNLPVVLPPQHLSVSMLTLLNDITNETVKRENSKQKSLSLFKGATRSERLLSCDIKDVVSDRNDGTAVRNHAKKTQENQSSVDEDAYNFSADLFYQSSIKILDVTENFSNADPGMQNCFTDINTDISEPSFHFSPPQQSTPVVAPPIQRIFRKQRKHSKKWSGLNQSKKSLTHTSISRVSHSNNSHGVQLLKPKFNQTSDSALETIEISAVGYGLNEKIKHTPGDSAFPTITNDCSGDLFDSLF